MTTKRVKKKPAVAVPNAAKCSHCAKPFTADNLVGLYLAKTRYHMSCAIKVGAVVVST